MQTPLPHVHTYAYSTSSHSFSSLSSTGPANSAFSQPRSVDHQTAVTAATAAAAVVAAPEEDSSLDANQSGDSVGNSSFGEESTSTNNTATPLTIGQQKATAILPEVHPLTGE